MRTLSTFIATLLFIQISSICLSQPITSNDHNVTINIPEVVLLDLESTNSKNIILHPEKPNSAGLAMNISSAVNNDLWINYSSVIGKDTEPSRNVTVALTGDIPAGVLLKVSASTDAGEGKGQTGIPEGAVILSSQPQSIISNIGTCYTGDGPNKGHQLTYSLELEDQNNYASLTYNESLDFTVIYTLTDNN